MFGPMTIRALFSALVLLVAAPLLAQTDAFLPLTTPVELDEGKPDRKVGELIFSRRGGNRARQGRDRRDFGAGMA